MRDLLTALLELQDLGLVLAEAQLVRGDARAQVAVALTARIGRLRAGVSTQDLRRFDALRRSGPAVVRERGGTCGGCHLNVTRGDLNRMRRCEVDWVCPNCGRYLFLSEPRPSAVE